MCKPQTGTADLAAGRTSVAPQETKETTLWTQGRGDPQGTISQSCVEL